MKTALVIEDVEDNMVLITKILKNAGYAILEARTGAEGYEMAISRRPDVIILDIQLPDMNGVEVLERIRASETDSNIMVVAMTSFAMAGDRERLLAAGCDGYIEKPIDPARVVEQIEKIIGKTA